MVYFALFPLRNPKLVISGGDCHHNLSDTLYPMKDCWIVNQSFFWKSLSGPDHTTQETPFSLVSVANTQSLPLARTRCSSTHQQTADADNPSRPPVAHPWLVGFPVAVARSLTVRIPVSLSKKTNDGGTKSQPVRPRPARRKGEHGFLKGAGEVVMIIISFISIERFSQPLQI